jgi:hypothetical protein
MTRPYKRRIGPQQRAVELRVILEPGLSMTGLAAILAPGKPTWQTFAAIHRAIEAGLIVGVPGPRRSLRLYPSLQEAEASKGFFYAPNGGDGAVPLVVPADLIEG